MVSSLLVALSTLETPVPSTAASQVTVTPASFLVKTFPQTLVAVTVPSGPGSVWSVSPATLEEEPWEELKKKPGTG